MDANGLNKRIVVNEKSFCSYCKAAIEIGDVAFICEISRDLSCRFCEIDDPCKAKKFVCKQNQVAPRAEHIHFRGIITQEGG